ncbi:hypothetical protein ON010_g5191 [Phytophthora cinnamomi]|nr:hypothetical protein ON010_g5191 [Phytophthora cinnamomi]
MTFRKDWSWAPYTQHTTPARTISAATYERASPTRPESALNADAMFTTSENNSSNAPTQQRRDRAVLGRHVHVARRADDEEDNGDNHYGSADHVSVREGGAEVDAEVEVREVRGLLVHLARVVRVELVRAERDDVGLDGTRADANAHEQAGDEDGVHDGLLGHDVRVGGDGHEEVADAVPDSEGQDRAEATPFLVGQVRAEERRDVADGRPRALERAGRHEAPADLLHEVLEPLVDAVVAQTLGQLHHQDEDAHLEKHALVLAGTLIPDARVRGAGRLEGRRLDLRRRHRGRNWEVSSGPESERAGTDGNRRRSDLEGWEPHPAPSLTRHSRQRRVHAKRTHPPCPVCTQLRRRTARGDHRDTLDKPTASK